MEDEDKLLYGDGGGEVEDSQDAVTNEVTGDGDPANLPNLNENSDKVTEVMVDEEDDDEDDDSDDDNVQIVIDQERIDEAKTSIGHNFGIKPSSRTLPSERKGRFNVEDFDQPGTIDGQTAHEVDVENLEEKPWRKPGADITDYFNYGFTEETWAAYCSRQKRMRINESGVGMPGNPNVNTANQNFSSKSQNGGTIPILGNNMKRPPPTIRESTSADSAPTTSGIQVLTADKREYSRKIFDNMDFSVPPPGMNIPPPTIPPPNFNAPPPVGDDFDAMADNYDDHYGYEPTAESQWTAPPSTYGGDRPINNDAPPGESGYDDKRDPWQRNGRRVSRESPGRERKRRRSRSRSREHSSSHRYSHRDRDRDRERGDRGDRYENRERDRRTERARRSRSRDRSDRDRRRDRSKSRSPRDSKSREKSPSGSHKHKKSKREKRDRSEKGDREIKKEIKEEPQEPPADE